MNKCKLAFAIFGMLTAGASSAVTLIWDASAGAEGYRVFCGDAPLDHASPPASVDVGAEVTWNDSESPFELGTAHECFVRAYNSLLESPDSNHIVFTIPSPPQTITVPGQPTSLTIHFQ